MQESVKVLPEWNLLTGSFYLCGTKESFSKDSGREVRAPDPRQQVHFCFKCQQGRGVSIPNHSTGIKTTGLTFTEVYDYRGNDDTRAHRPFWFDETKQSRFWFSSWGMLSVRKKCIICPAHISLCFLLSW